MSDFELAVKYVNKGPAGSFSPSDNDKLTFYKYYKQATVGPCTTAQPGITQMKERAKWNAWNEVKEVSAEAAKEKYIEHLTKLAPTWRDVAPTL